MSNRQLGSLARPFVSLIFTSMACSAAACVEAQAPASDGTANVVVQTSPSSTPTVAAPALPFPSRDDLNAVAGQPLSSGIHFTAASVPRWTITAPIPTHPLGPETDTGIWTNVAREVAAKHGASVELSPALRCAAQELATFDSTKGAMPIETLSQFVLARCGWPYSLARPGVVFFKVPAVMTDAQIQRHAATEATTMIASKLPEGAGKLGVASARHGDRLTVAYIWATPTVDLEPTYATVEGGAVHLRGTFHGDVGQATALANGDGYSVTRCTQETVALPQFSFTCPIGKTEASWVSLSTVAPGKLLGRQAVAFLAQQHGDLSLTWEAPPAPPTPPLEDASSLGETVLAPLNQLRAACGAKPVTLAKAQSKTNAALAPHMVEGGTLAAQTADTVVLGVMAGWDVEGATVSGGIVTVDTVSASTAGEWLAMSLMQPAGRLALLSPPVDQVAIGAARIPETSLLVAIASSYSTFSGSEHPKVADALAERLLRERSAQGHPAPDRVDLSTLDVAIRTLADDGASPTNVLQGSLKDFVAASRKGAHGMVITTSDPMTTPLPPALMRAGKVTYALAVGHQHRAGMPWGEYVEVWVWNDEY